MKLLFKVLLLKLLFIFAFSTSSSVLAVTFQCNTGKGGIFPKSITITSQSGKLSQSPLFGSAEDLRLTGSRVGGEFITAFLSGVTSKGSIRYNYGSDVFSNSGGFNFIAKFYGEKSTGRTNLLGNSASDNFVKWQESAKYSCRLTSPGSISNKVEVAPKSTTQKGSGKKILEPDCGTTTANVREAQKLLKDLGFYSYAVDGVMGRGTRAALIKAKTLIGQRASDGDCITAFDLSGLRKLANEKSCAIDTIMQCTEDAICSKATVIRSGIRSWNLENQEFISRARQLSLDCGITVDNIRLSQEEAVYFLTSLKDYVNSNGSVFDLQFASEFNKVRPITTGEWSADLSSAMEDFRAYVDKFPAFQQHLDELRIAENAAKQKRIQQLRNSITNDMIDLRKWANANVLDEKAAEIARLDASLGDKSLQNVNTLEQLTSEAQRLLFATGLIDDPASAICSVNNIDACSEEQICEKATALQDGKAVWQSNIFKETADLMGLACGIKEIFTQSQAEGYLKSLVDYVNSNGSVFDLQFASEFNKIRPITTGEWSADLSSAMEDFRAYVDKFPAFQQHLDELRFAENAAKQKRIQQLRNSITNDMQILKAWADQNVLDEKAAEIARLDASLGDKSLQNVNTLEQLTSEAQRLLFATGIKDGIIAKQTDNMIDSLFEPGSIYIFANTSGNAASIYKTLDGSFSFEQNAGTYCISEKVDLFDRYLVLTKVFLIFGDLQLFEEDCSETSDIFIAKGNELTNSEYLGYVSIGDLFELANLQKSERDLEFTKLSFLKDTIKNDVLNGTRLGFGILKKPYGNSIFCGIIDDNYEGHTKEIGKRELLISALDFRWQQIETTIATADEAFKLIQRGNCDLVYASTKNLNSLFLASQASGMPLEFLPIWISEAEVKETQELYDADMAAKQKVISEAKQNLKTQEKLDLQAQKSAEELAAVRQQNLREKNGLRFMVLKDELQEIVFKATEFGFNHPLEAANYEQKYLEQSFVDQNSGASPFDGLIKEMQRFSAERWEITEKRIDQVDFGSARFNDREVDAINIELKVSMVNRLVGKYLQFCQSVLALKDEDFDMWRNVSLGNCSQDFSNEQWKGDNSFASKWIVEPQ